MAAIFKLTVADAKYIKKNGKLQKKKDGNQYHLEKFYRLRDVYITEKWISGKFADMPTDGTSYFDVKTSRTVKGILFS